MARPGVRWIAAAAASGAALVLWWLAAHARGDRGPLVPAGSVAEEVAPPAVPAVSSSGASQDDAEPLELDRSSRSPVDEAHGDLAIQVRVTDFVDERPIAGARVRVEGAGVPRELATDVAGLCSFVVRESEEPLRVRVDSAGYVHTSEEYEREQELEVELMPATALHGRVLAADTLEPVSGARLELVHECCDGCGPTVCVTGSDGRYELDEVPLDASPTLVVRADGFACSEPEFYTGATSSEREQDIRLPRGLLARGRVVDWTSGGGITGATLGGLATDAEGRFEGRLSVRPGTTTAGFTIRADGYPLLSHRADLSVERELEYRLPRPAFFEGTVASASGVPLAGADVHAESRRGSAGEPQALQLAGWPRDQVLELDSTASTDAAGHYRLPVLPWNESVVGASSPGFVYAPTVGTAGTPESLRRLDLVLAAEEGRPARLDGFVTLNGSNSSALRGSVTWRGATRGGTERFESNFDLAVEPGDVALSVALDLVSGIAEGAETNVQARAGRSVSAIVALRVPALEIAGSVRFDDGEPAPGALVLARCGQDDEVLCYRTQTDRRGAFGVAVPDIGQVFALEARFHGQQREREGVRAGARDVDLELPRPHLVLVRVFDAVSETALALDELVALFAREPGDTFRRATLSNLPDLSGWNEAWIAGTRADLLLVPVDSALQACGTMLRPGIDLRGTPRLEFRLERAASLAIELDRPEDLPESWLLLIETELWDDVRRSPQRWESDIAGLPFQRRVEFDEHGRAELTGLAPGEYRFKALREDLRLEPERVLVDRDTPPVTLRWSLVGTADDE